VSLLPGGLLPGAEGGGGGGEGAVTISTLAEFYALMPRVEPRTNSAS
jgi:hypothetical protein